jgi:hypothetical protein
MSASTSNVTIQYDAEGNIIQTVGASQGTAENLVTSPLTIASVNPNVAPTGTSNQPLNAKPVNTANLQIGASTGSTLASLSNPA